MFSSQKAKPALRVLKTLFSITAMLAIGLVAWQSRGALATQLHSLQFTYLIIAILLWAALHFISPIFSSTILSGCGSTTPYSLALKIHADRLPARYLPGGIWHTVARFADFRDNGAQTAHVLTFVILETALAPAVSFVLGGLIVFFFNRWDSWGVIGLLSCTAGALLISLVPILAKFRLFSRYTPISLNHYARCVLIYIAFWAVAATAFVSYFLSVTRHAMPVLEIAGAYLFSWAVGNIAFFAPQGIGVFEVTVSGLLHDTMSIAELTVLIAGFRLVILIADILVWLLSLAWRRHKALP